MHYRQRKPTIIKIATVIKAAVIIVMVLIIMVYPPIMAGPRGIEPLSSDLESDGIPLHQGPILSAIPQPYR